MSKLNLSSIKLEPVHLEEHKQECALSKEQILQLYEAKCKDLDLKASQQNLDKFVKFCYKYCYTGRLCFPNCGFGTNVATVLNKFILENQRICRLDLSLNNLEDEGCMIIAKSLSKSTSLVSVNLSSNEIRTAGAQYLLKSLVSNNSIVEIILSSIGIEAKKNRMKSEGVKPLRLLLDQNKILTFLDLSGNCIGKEGLNYIMQGLRENRSLLSLKISKNDIPGECLNDLFRTIKYTKISELDISGNPIGNQSAIDGIDEIMNCFELKILNFSDCSLTVLGLEGLFRKLSSKNLNLLVLILDKNDFKEWRCESMTDFIRSTNTLK